MKQKKNILKVNVRDRHTTVMYTECVLYYYYASDEEGFSDETITFVLVMGNINRIIFYACCIVKVH